MHGISFETRFAVGALATWRIAHLVAYEDGPGDVIVRVRSRAGDSPLGGLMDCFYCLTVWVAVPVTFATVRDRRAGAVVCMALSGAACLLERMTDPCKGVPIDPESATEAPMG